MSQDTCRDTNSTKYRFGYVQKTSLSDEASPKPAFLALCLICPDTSIFWQISKT